MREMPQWPAQRQYLQKARRFNFDSSLKDVGALTSETGNNSNSASLPERLAEGGKALYSPRNSSIHGSDVLLRDDLDKLASRASVS